MFFTKLRRGLCGKKGNLAKRIPARWKLAIAGLLGIAAGLFILTVWNPDGAIVDKSAKESPEVQSPSLILRAATAPSIIAGRSSSHCSISNCDKVVCLSISESMNPGKVASDFITQTFTIQCPASRLKLTFESCAFPNNRLESDWLSADLPKIEELSFSKCALEDLTNGSFASGIFANLESISVNAEKMRIFRKSTFDELRYLKGFIVEDNVIQEAEYDLLRYAADSLEVLSLNGCLRDTRVLANITGHRNFINVKILSIQRNNLEVIPSELFESMPNLESIYLQESKVKIIEAGALRSTRSLKLLDLRNNLLEKLPSESLNPLLTTNPNFRISMSNNPWNCSCDFDWMREIVASNPERFSEVPKCETPARNALSYFTRAKFCDGEMPTDSTTRRTTVQPEEENQTKETESFVKFTCKNYETLMISGAATGRKSSSTSDEWELPSRYPDFAVRSLDNGDVSINVRKNQDRLSLVWFENVDRETERSIRMSSRSIDCVNNVQDSFVLENLTSGATYTFCLLENSRELSSPLNCLAARTAAGRSSSDSSGVWLTNGEKPAVLSISMSLLVIVGILTALSSFLVIRRNPSLLRGSKRIVMVRKRGIEALVMPVAEQGTRGINSRIDEPAHDEAHRGRADKWWTDERRLRDGDENYLTPLESRKCRGKNSAPYWGSTSRRKDSKVSRMSSFYSGGSYVSGIEATPSELYDWRNTARIKNHYGYARTENHQHLDETPKIPPLPRTHRRRSIDAAAAIIPSLSLAVDSQNRRRSPPRHSHVDRRTSPHFIREDEYIVAQSSSRGEETSFVKL